MACLLKRIWLVDAVDAAGTPAFGTGVPVQGSKPTVGVSAAPTADSPCAVVEGGPIGGVEDAGPCVVAQVYPRVLGDEDAILSVRINRVIGHGSVRRAI